MSSSRGRPAVSLVRSRLLSLLFVFGECSAYDLHRFYVRCFAGVTRRNVYYQSRKAVALGLAVVRDQVDERGRRVLFGLSEDGEKSISQDDLAVARAFKKAFVGDE